MKAFCLRQQMATPAFESQMGTSVLENKWALFPKTTNGTFCLKMSIEYNFVPGNKWDLLPGTIDYDFCRGKIMVTSAFHIKMGTSGWSNKWGLFSGTVNLDFRL